MQKPAIVPCASATRRLVLCVHDMNIGLTRDLVGVKLPNVWGEGPLRASRAGPIWPRVSLGPVGACPWGPRRLSMPGSSRHLSSPLVTPSAPAPRRSAPGGGPLASVASPAGGGPPPRGRQGPCLGLHRAGGHPHPPRRPAGRPGGI